MKHLYLIVLLVIITGCTEFDHTPEFRIDPRLEVYVTAFYNEAAQRNIQLHKDLIVEIGSLEKDVNGRTKYMGQQRIVIINQSFYDYYILQFAPKMDSMHYMLEHLMYHELGHALLYREHCGSCYSIMSRDISLSEYVVKPDKRQLLIDELFTEH